MAEKIRNVAVFFGGFSSEYSVSLESAYSVICNLKKEKYRVIPVGISKEGKWFYYGGDIQKIPVDQWQSDAECIPALLSPERGSRTLYLLKKEGLEAIPVDVAFPVMHGKYGEDGTVQGLIELADIPLVGCGVLSSALCMDKDRAHKLAEYAGITVPKSLALQKNYDKNALDAFSREVGYPLFVKPVKSGSSYGVTKVCRAEDLRDAVDFAFEFDNEVLVEQGIDGFEVSCAVLGNEELLIGEVAEIETNGSFFDFTEKYTHVNTAVHIPARIPEALAQEVKEIAKKLYQALACRGFARVDLFITPDQKIVFNEINTIPGFTEHSLYPAMMKTIGLSFPDVMDRLVELARQ